MINNAENAVDNLVCGMRRVTDRMSDEQKVVYCNHMKKLSKLVRNKKFVPVMYRSLKGLSSYPFAAICEEVNNDLIQMYLSPNHLYTLVVTELIPSPDT